MLYLRQQRGSHLYQVWFAIHPAQSPQNQKSELPNLHPHPQQAILLEDQRVLRLLLRRVLKSLVIQIPVGVLQDQFLSFQSSPSPIVVHAHQTSLCQKHQKPQWQSPQSDVNANNLSGSTCYAYAQIVQARGVASKEFCHRYSPPTFCYWLPQVIHLSHQQPRQYHHIQLDYVDHSIKWLGVKLAVKHQVEPNHASAQTSQYTIFALEALWPMPLRQPDVHPPPTIQDLAQSNLVEA